MKPAISTIILIRIVMKLNHKKKRFGAIAAALILSLLFLTQTSSAQPIERIVIDKNLKPGMPLKKAIELLGPSERIDISDTGTIIMPYDAIGLSLELLSGSTTVEAIHLQQGFKGRFASGLAMGDDIQRIIADHDQPDTRTERLIEYSMPLRRYIIDQGKLSGADLYKDKSALYHVKAIKRFEEKATGRQDKGSAETAFERVITHAEDEDDYYKEEEKKKQDEINVFELYGFRVKQEYSRVVITEVTPGSFADEGGLKVGEPIRKVFYDKSSERNIYAVSGLRLILRRAIEKQKRTVNILQSQNYYVKVKVPRLYKRL